MHSSFQIAARVWHALILREINGRYGDSRLGYLWALITPLLSIFVLYMIYSMFRDRDTGEMPLLMFLVTGWFTYGFFQSLCQSIANGEQANRALLMHQNVTRLDVMIARGALETLTTISFFAIAAIISAALEGGPPPSDMGLVFFSFATAGLLGLGVGTMMGAVMTFFPVAMNFLMPVLRIGFFMSGILFTADMLPSWTHQYVRWNPMIHPVEGVRQGWFETYQSPLLDLSYPISIALPLIALGLYLERRTRRRIRFT